MEHDSISTERPHFFLIYLASQCKRRNIVDIFVSNLSKITLAEDHKLNKNYGTWFFFDIASFKEPNACHDLTLVTVDAARTLLVSKWLA